MSVQGNVLRASCLSDIIWLTNTRKKTTISMGTAVVGEGAHRCTVYMARRNEAGYQYYEPRGTAIIVAAIERKTIPLYLYGAKTGDVVGCFDSLTQNARAHADAVDVFLVAMKALLAKHKIAYHGLMHSKVRMRYTPDIVAAALYCTDTMRRPFTYQVFDPTLGILPGGGGLACLRSVTGTPRIIGVQWSNAIAVALQLSRLRPTCKETAFLAANPPLMEMLAAAALVILAGPYPGEGERTDDRTHPALGLYSIEDCDGKGIAVASYACALHEYVRNYTDSKDLLPYIVAVHMTETFVNDPLLVHCMVDPDVAHARARRTRMTRRHLVGHVVVALARRDKGCAHRNLPADSPAYQLVNALIIDGTTTESPHVPPDTVDTINAQYRDINAGSPLFEDECAGGPGGLHRIKRADSRAIATVVAVYSSTRMFVVKKAPTTCTSTAMSPCIPIYNTRTMRYDVTHSSREAYDRTCLYALDCVDIFRNGLWVRPASMPTKNEGTRLHLRLQDDSMGRSTAAVLSGAATLVEMPHHTGPEEVVPPHTIDLDAIDTFARTGMGHDAIHKLQSIPEFYSLLRADEAPPGSAVLRVAAFVHWAVYMACIEVVDRVKLLTSSATKL